MVSLGYGCGGKYYWDLKDVPDWNTLIHVLPESKNSFVINGVALNARRNRDKRDYLSANGLDRFETLFEELLAAIDQKDKTNCNLPLKEWILLGAVTEVTLQVIIAIYYSDYLNERWQQWVNVDADYMLNKIDAALENEVNIGKLTSKQKKSIKEAVNRKIKEHTMIHDVDRIMLDELIQFTQKTKLLLDDSINDKLKIIQKNRNCIHAFSNRSIDGWEALQASLNTLGYIWDDFSYRFEAECNEEV